MNKILLSTVAMATLVTANGDVNILNDNVVEKTQSNKRAKAAFLIEFMLKVTCDLDMRVSKEMIKTIPIEIDIV